MKRLIRVIVSGLVLAMLLAMTPAPRAAEGKLLYRPELETLAKGETLPDELGREHNGFVSDGKGGLVSATDDVYNASYFGVPTRQYHFHAEMEPVVPGQAVVGGLSMKVNLDLDPGGAKRMDLAVTTGGDGKSVLIYAFGTLICDNRNIHQGGAGEESNDFFNATDKVLIDLYGDRDYVAVFINGQLVIENILPLEGKGVFGIRSSSSAIRYSNLYIEELGDTLLDGRERYYPETFETLSMQGPASAGTGEEAAFSVALFPEGKAYESVQWTVDGEVVMDATDLDHSFTFGEPGEHEVSCVVDRQRATSVITVTENLLTETGPGGEREERIPLAPILICCVGVLAFAIVVVGRRWKGRNAKQKPKQPGSQ